MGLTFNGILIRKCNTPAQTRKAFISVMKNSGYELTSDAENGIAVRFASSRKSAYVCVSGGFFLQVEAKTLDELLSSIAQRNHTPVLFLANFDSDWLEGRLYSEGQKQVFDYGTPPEPASEKDEQLDLFVSLLPDEKARKVFEGLVHNEQVFSEEVVWGMAPRWALMKSCFFPQTSILFPPLKNAKRDVCASSLKG